MASTPAPTSPAGALVVDANIAIALFAKEAGRHPKATAELRAFTAQGYVFYAPGVIISETLYVLCGKARDGTLSPADHATAVTDFALFMSGVIPPPNGDSSLISRAAGMNSGYGCSRSSDSIYLALAEELTSTLPTEVLTFDADLPNQAARNAPTVTVRLLVP